MLALCAACSSGPAGRNPGALSASADAGLARGSSGSADAGLIVADATASITGVAPNPWNLGILETSLLYFPSVAAIPPPPYSLTLRLSELVFVVSTDAVRPFLPPAFEPTSSAGQSELLVAAAHYLTAEGVDSGVVTYNYDEVAFLVPVNLPAAPSTQYFAYLKLHLNQAPPIDTGRQVYGFPKYLDDSIVTTTDPTLSPSVTYEGRSGGTSTFSIEAVRAGVADLGGIELPAGLPDVGGVLGTPGLFINPRREVTVGPMSSQLGSPELLLVSHAELPELQEAGILFPGQLPAAALQFDHVTLDLSVPLTPDGTVIPFPPP